MTAIWFCCRASNAAWIRLTPRSTGWRKPSPLIKKNLLEACVHTVGADGVILEGEAELLRAVADTLDCPMPPFVPAE